MSSVEERPLPEASAAGIRIPDPRAAEELASSLLDPRLPGLLPLLEEGRPLPPGLEVLDHGPFRSVLRLSGPSGSVIAKLFRRRARRHLLGARKEAERILEARARGCRVPGLFAASELGHAHWMFRLLLEDLGPGSTLSGFEDPRVFEEAGRFLASLYARGLAHGDLHPGQLHRGKEGRWSLLDLREVRFRDGPVRPTWNDLLGLCLPWPWPEDEAKREALLGALSFPAAPPGFPALLRAHWKKRRSRALRDSGPFRRVGRAILRRNAGLPADPAAILEILERGERIRAGRRGTVVRSRLGFGKLREGRRAEALWLAAHDLELRGLPAPRALALIPAGGGGSWVLSAALDEGGRSAPSLDDLARAGPLPLAAAEDLGRLLARLHASGLRHRDLKGDNLRFPGGRAHLVDLDGLRPLPRLRREAARAADLARLLAWWRFQADRPRGEDPGRLPRTLLRAYYREGRALDLVLPPPRRLAAAVGLGCAAWRRRHERKESDPLESGAASGGS